LSDNIANPPNQLEDNRKQINWNNIIPFFVMETIVIFNTWAGFLRFLNLDNYIHTFESFQQAFFFDNLFLLATPILWGAFLWVVINYVNDLLCPDHSVGLWKTLAFLIFKVKNIVAFFILIIGCLLPYVLMWLFKKTNLPTFGGSILLFLVSSILWLVVVILFVNRNLTIHEKLISQISMNDLAYKTFFYKFIIPFLVPFSLILSLQIVPETIGKIWGVYQIYKAPSSSNETKLINISTDVCWKEKQKLYSISYFLELDNKVVYIKKYKDNKWNSSFFDFFKNYCKGKQPEFRLCVISLDSLEISGTYNEFIGEIDP
jgi:hypothetical protein